VAAAVSPSFCWPLVQAPRFKCCSAAIAQSMGGDFSCATLPAVHQAVGG
jgi:hypothetical protein